MHSINNFLNVSIGYLIKNWIAIVSLIFSYVTWYKNRKIITFDFNPNILLADPNSIICFTPSGEVESYEYCFVTSLSVVNPSNQDIGFFDLRAFNPETNINFQMVTSNTFPPDIQDKSLYQITDDTKLVKLDYPERKFGVFKANSFTKIDIVLVVSDKDNFDNITVNFKIPKKLHFSFLRDRFALTSRKIYAHKGFNYIIPGGSVKQIHSLREQQIQSENAKDNTQQQSE
ncbi:hypothetical protein EFT49_06225 [Leuconostoc falkenbergense]|uniref:hypothetical protein n=1 Tax=Leuconostoc falkenbergense TaxID=2766470 RepID=UPI0021A9A943|nr:hypothetical protein [Leuconostoc falkenbergense]MCT4419808.1 hypothetical protein [Leuconostoc falkenbergense]